MIIARLIINLEGAKHLTHETEEVFTGSSTIKLQIEGDRSYGPKIKYEPYSGISHSVSLIESEVTQVLPIRDYTWKAWTTNTPSRSALRSLSINHKTALKKFNELSEFQRVMLHAEDITTDLLFGVKPQYGVNYTIEII